MENGIREVNYLPEMDGSVARILPEGARHSRSYAREDLIFNPLHYLSLPEKKIGAPDQAAPLVGWGLPDAFLTLRRLLESRMGKSGKREYVQVLGLLETFELDDLQGRGEGRLTQWRHW